MSYKTIVLATDLGALTAPLLESGLEVAKTHNLSQIHLLHVVNTIPVAAGVPYTYAAPQLEMFEKQAVAAAQAKLESIASKDKGVEFRIVIRKGHPAREIAAYATEVKADVILVSSHGYGALRRTLFGSVSSGLIRTAPCPVLVVGPDRAMKAAPKSILAAVDLSPVSRTVLAEAVRMARPSNAHLQVVSLYEHPLVAQGDGNLLPQYLDREEIEKLGDAHRTALENMVKEVQTPGLKVTLEVASKAPAAVAILELAAMVRPDILVLGTSGHSGWHRMVVGSTATRVISEAEAPVLVVPHAAATDGHATKVATHSA